MWLLIMLHHKLFSQKIYYFPVFNAVLDDLLLSSFQRNSNQDIGCFFPALFTFINVCKVLANTCYLLFKRDYTRLYLTQNYFHCNTSKVSVTVNVIIYLNYELGIHKSHFFKMNLYIFLIHNIHRICMLLH